MGSSMRDAANRPGLLVLLPAGTDEVAAHDALHGRGIGFFHQHAAAFEPLSVRLAGRGKIGNVRADEMMGNDVFHRVEPVRGERREDFSLVGNLGRKHHVEAGNPVRSDHQKVVAQVVHLPYLAAFEKLQPRDQTFAHLARSRAIARSVPCSPGQERVADRYPFLFLVLM
jgi:hypothetical protein